MNTASRMESAGVPGAVQCAEDTAKLPAGAFPQQERGPVAIKGKGPMQTFLLAAAAPVPDRPTRSQ